MMSYVCLIITIALYARTEIFEGVDIIKLVSIEHYMRTLLFQCFPFPVMYSFIG